MPQNIVRRNRKHLHPATNPVGVEKTAELEPDQEQRQNFSPASTTGDVQELSPTLTQFDELAIGDHSTTP